MTKKNVVIVGPPESTPGRRVYRGAERDRLFPGPSKEAMERMERLERMAVCDPFRLRAMRFC